MKAQFYQLLEDQKVMCELCPHNCIIPNEKTGKCKVRTNSDGILISENYGLVSSIGFDSIEKKPLYHFYPGKEILSIGSLGCNLKCEFCQNWQISQTSVSEFKRESQFYGVDEIVHLAESKNGNIGIAYTYNEPTVFIEYMIDIARKAQLKELKNVMVTNGFINQEPLNVLNKYIDAYSVDLKAFNDDFFVKYTGSKFEPVKETLVNIVNSGKHLEITSLIIPGLNDEEKEFEQMLIWIKENLGKDIVLHISRYYPTYKFNIEQTSVKKMLELNKMANDYLNYVYLGNILLPEGNITSCPNCNEPLINRYGYMIQKRSVNDAGNCIKCGTHVFNYIN